MSGKQWAGSNKYWHNILLFKFVILLGARVITSPFWIVIKKIARNWGECSKLNKKEKKAADALKILAFHAKHKQLSSLTRYSFISPFLVCLKMRLIYIFLSSVRVLCSNKLYNSRPVIRLFFTIADSVSTSILFLSPSDVKIEESFGAIVVFQKVSKLKMSVG